MTQPATPHGGYETTQAPAAGLPDPAEVAPGAPRHLATAPAPPPVQVGPDGILDFSPPDEELAPKVFRIGPRDEDIFTAAAGVPVTFGIEYVNALRARDDEGVTASELFLELLRKCLFPESRERFEARYTSAENPIDHRILFRVTDGLMERWGMRPTRPSEPSSGGSPNPDAGTSSAAEQPSPASTSPANPSTGDSTSPMPLLPPDSTPTDEPTST
jgi:hypothetical protein